MAYTEVVFEISPFEQGKEILIALLGELGYYGFMEEENLLFAYINSNQFDKKQIYDIQKNISNHLSLKFKLNNIKKTNWNKQWESNFQPAWITSDLLVRAPFHKPAKKTSVTEIIIEPKMSFGTAHHPTTYLVLKEMMKMKFTGLNVLDFGCGTGVLGILASMKGAEKVCAIDNDEWACENAKDNARLNNVNIFVDKGGFEKASNGLYNIILANITKNILAEHMVDFYNALREGGQLLLSGFYLDDQAYLLGRADEAGLKLVNSMKKEGWLMLHMEKDSQ